MIWNITQPPWVYFNCPTTHPLRFEVIRNMLHGVWIVLHCPITHPSRFEVIRNTLHSVWIFFDSLIAHPLCLKRTGTNSNNHDAFSTPLSHIPCILRWSETYIREYGFLHTAELHILSVLCSSGTIHKNPGSHSTAVSSAARGPRASFICFIGWKKKIAVLFDLFRPGKGQILWPFLS